jgi:DNA-binding LytR/AlgR family response regulator
MNHSAGIARTRPVKALIAEDEANLCDDLREALATLWPELTICAVATDGVQALQQMEEHAPDVLFLDIRMPGISGLEVAKRASGNAHVVFVTAYDNYAVAAFEQGAVDYVMKPFDPERLADTSSGSKRASSRRRPTSRGCSRRCTRSMAAARNISAGLPPRRDGSFA